MRPRRAHLLAMIACLSALPTALIGPAGAQVTGWPQFQGGPGHVGAVAAGPEPGYRTAWATREVTGGPQGSYGLSAPVIADGEAVAAGPTRVVAFDLTSGETTWSLDRVLGPPVAPAVVDTADGPLILFTEGWGDGPPDATATPTPSDGDRSGSGSPSEPAVDAGTTTPRLVAAPARGGDPVWALDLPDVSRTGVTVAGELAIVGSIDGSVVAADVATGSSVWTAELGAFLDTPIAASGEEALVSILGDDDTAPGVVALSLVDGSESWRYEPQPATFSIGSPSVGEGAAYVSLRDGSVRAISLVDGTESWRASLNAYVSPFAPAAAPVLVDDGVIVADVRGQLYRLDATTGERVWDHAYNHPVVRSSPVVVGEHVVLATADGRVAAFELGGGDLVWEGLASTGAATTSPLRGMAVGGDAIVVVRGGIDAGMVGLAHDPAAAMVRVISPTTLDPAALLSAWLAAVIVAAVLFVIGRPLWGRLGPVDIPSEDDIVQEDEA